MIWISAAKPGRSSEIVAARHNKITAHLREAKLGALADLGFVGLDDDPDDNPVIITGRKATRNHKLTEAEKKANRLVSRERAANEHGFANLKTWRILTKVRRTPATRPPSCALCSSWRTPKCRGDKRSPATDHDPDQREHLALHPCQAH
ncbi:transposase family protein [Streptomyces sp. NPDC048484]|uniref:transposase family protein n=1 Tax=Streptomyces sp. NPDC048484 TaxID=3155146 RepID=UPI003449C5FA